MNTPGLFIMGAIVTLIVAGAIAMLIYGAILDGRAAQDDARGAAELGAEERETADSAAR